MNQRNNNNIRNLVVPLNLDNQRRCLEGKKLSLFYLVKDKLMIYRKKYNLLKYN